MEGVTQMAALQKGAPGKGAFPVPATVPAELREVGKELSRIEESARYSSQGQFEQAKIWRKVNAILGTTSALMTAAAGVLTFAKEDLEFWAGGAAIMAALLVAAMTAVAPERHATRAQQAAVTYLAVQGRARRALLIELSGVSGEEALEILKTLSAERDEANRMADPISRVARGRARRNIECGGQVFGVDQT
jgi:hypothetical protein